MGGSGAVVRRVFERAIKILAGTTIRPSPARLLGVREWVGYSLDDIGRMADLLERAAKQEDEKTSATHQEKLTAYAANPFPPGEAPSFADWAVDMWRYRMTVPQHARRAALTLVCSGVEGTLVRFCEWLQDEKQLRKHVTEMRGAGLERIQRYARWGRFPFPSGSARWAELNDLMRVRNVMVHRLGIVKPGRDGARIRKYAARRKTLLGVEEDGEIILYEGLPAHAVKVGNEFLEELVKLCPPPPPLPPLEEPGPNAGWLAVLAYEKLKKMRGE